MKIKLKKLVISNFKGIKSLEIELKDGINQICGGNATGKTTIFDSFLWVLFGKDSSDKKDFNVKTLDIDGNEIPKIEHNVKVILDIDGLEKIFSRTMREKWTKKSGSLEEVFSGNETLYEINNVPVKMSEYQKKVSEMIDETLFKTITNVSYFCGQKWQTQREILMSMADMGADEELAKENGCTRITEILNAGKTVEERAKELANNKKRIKKELDAVPIRIDELTCSLPENDMRTSEEVHNDIEKCRNDIKTIEKEISIAEQSDSAEIEIRKIETEMFNAKAEAEVTNAEIKAENLRLQSEHKKKVSDIEDKIAMLEKSVKECRKECSEGTKCLERLRAEYKEEHGKKFDNTVCPCCGRAYDDTDLEKMKSAFNAEKANKLREISQRGKSLKDGIENNNKAADEKTKEIEILKKTLSEMEPPTLKKLKNFDDSEYLKKIDDIKNGTEKIDTSDLKAKLKELEEQKAVLDNEMGIINSVENITKRISALEADLKEKSQAVADIEKEEAELQKFIEMKINKLGAAVNSKFKIVKFKLFDYQINGGYSEACEATVDGVPYRNLNSAAKINAGLDIISALQDYYNIKAPVFIDNKESVNKVYSLADCQMVYLTVTNDTELKINKED